MRTRQSLELRKNMDENQNERLSKSKTAASVIKKYRLLYNGVELPKWVMTYTPGQLKGRAIEKPGIRPSAGKNYDKRILSDGER
jgi:hypothetical protein